MVIVAIIWQSSFWQFLRSDRFKFFNFPIVSYLLYRDMILSIEQAATKSWSVIKKMTFQYGRSTLKKNNNNEYLQNLFFLRPKFKIKFREQMSGWLLVVATLQIKTQRIVKNKLEFFMVFYARLGREGGIWDIQTKISTSFIPRPYLSWLIVTFKYYLLLFRQSKMSAMGKPLN